MDLLLNFRLNPPRKIHRQGEKLRDGKYNVSIVFTSSLEGAYFNGAIGSTLLIDEV